jgi:hypothetical protein
MHTTCTKFHINSLSDIYIFISSILTFEDKALD